MKNKKKLIFIPIEGYWKSIVTVKDVPEVCELSTDAEN